MRAHRRMVTIGLPTESRIAAYAAKHGVSFSMALVMIVTEWEKGATLLPDGYPLVHPPDLPGERRAVEIEMEHTIGELIKQDARKTLG